MSQKLHGWKRRIPVTGDLSMKKPRWIITDIEGTTTSISFVHDTLFPYARTHMPSFLSEHHDNQEVNAQIQAIKVRLKLTSLNEVSVVLDQWMREDRKETELKALQGLLWRKGYEAEDFKGHVYSDVEPALRRWDNAGIFVGIYSSGSVAAQRLLFGCSEAGDLSRYLKAYFDTRIGHKKVAASYRAIANDLGVSPDDIVFLSDVGDELSAASESGLAVVQLLRENVIRDDRFPGLDSFDDLDGLWS